MKVLRKLALALACFSLYLCLPYVAAAAGPVIWTEDSLTHVMKTDPARSASLITLYTAKNEYEPFQIVVKAPTTNNLTNVTVSVTNFAGPNGTVIPTSNITLYRAHYVTVTQGSKRHVADTNHPLGPGLYPDALVPFKNPTTGADLSGVIDAVPFTVLAGENQPVWVDIYTPATTASGQYSATATVTSNEGSGEVHIVLNVWNFTLPTTRSLKGWTSTISPYKTRDTNIELIKHRISPKNIPRSDERFFIDNYGLDLIEVFRASGATRFTCVPTSAPLVSEVQAEAALHEPELYLVNAYANEVFNCPTYGPAYIQWANNLRQGGIHPHITSWPLTEFMGADLDHTAGDLWSFLPKHYDLGKTNIEKLVNHPGIQVWSYNPLVQDEFSPKFTIDFSPINARIMQGFINQSLGLTGTKFWRVDNWTTDPWNNAEVSRVDAPGEGHMVYRGDDVGLPNQIVAGIRIKGHREGSEDFEYIEMLKKAGETQFAMDTVRSVATDFRTWTKDKNVLFAARKALGDKLHALNTGNTPTPTGPGCGPVGDINCSGQIDIMDLSILLSAYGTSSDLADLDNSGIVNIFDLSILLKNYNL